MRRRSSCLGPGLAVALGAVGAAGAGGPVVGWGLGEPPPVAVVSAIAAGFNHSCAIQAGTGQVVCWDSNEEGEANPPLAVDGTTGTASAIAAGGAYSCAIQAGTGQVVCWGYNDSGQAAPPPAVDGTTGTASAIAAAPKESPP